MNSPDLNWQNMQLFLSVAENGSFSGAARELRLGQPTLSRRIAEFEDQLGAPLFVRLSQGCELTPFGSKLLPAAEQMAMWSVEALAQIQTPDKIQGRVRITAPPAIAFALLPPFAAELATLFPDLQLEVLSTVNTLNLARGEADISLRTQKPKEDNLICLASFTGEMKAYICEQQANELPENIDIKDLKWICWPDDFDQMQSNQALKKAIPDFKPVFTSDDYNVQIAACCSGVGVLVLPEGFEHCTFLSQLIPLPVDLGENNRGECHIVTHKRQMHLPRVVEISEQLQRYLSRFWPKATT